MGINSYFLFIDRSWPKSFHIKNLRADDGQENDLTKTKFP